MVNTLTVALLVILGTVGFCALLLYGIARVERSVTRHPEKQFRHGEPE